MFKQENHWEGAKGRQHHLPPSKNAVTFPEQILDFIWHNYITWLFLEGQASECLAFIVQVLGAGKEEGVDN